MVKSPCVAVCKIDYESGYCIGCKRTIEEIANWSILNDQQKKKILAKVKSKNTSKQKVFSSNQNE
tara:strand:+ start:1578 stop:1772 length:195 start_codon:yes stop_codon:yes gene_type:complete